MALYNSDKGKKVVFGAIHVHPAPFRPEFYANEIRNFFLTKSGHENEQKWHKTRANRTGEAARDAVHVAPEAFDAKQQPWI
jgi:hypothetical protein